MKFRRLLIKFLESDLFETTASERIKQKQQNFEKMRKKKLRRLQPQIIEPLYDQPDRFDWDTTPLILIKVKIKFIYTYISLYLYIFI